VSGDRAAPRLAAFPGRLVPFLLRAIHKSRQLTEAPLLVRLDSAHDAIMTLVTLASEQVDFIVKWNPRGTECRQEPARSSPR
jgi:hypothetical protein